MASKDAFSSPSNLGRRPRFQPPTIRRHAASRRARARINGRTYWLGPWEGKHPSPEAQAKFDALLAEWMRRKTEDPSPIQVTRTTPTIPTPTETPVIGAHSHGRRITVAELLAAYCDHAETYYRKPDGTHTSSIFLVRRTCVAMTPFLETPADSFGPLKFSTLIDKIAAQQPLCRRTINALAKCIRRIFAWGASRELVPGTVHHALSAVPLLKKGRSPAVDYAEVPPIADEVIDKTVPFMPPMIQDMVKLQRLTGARPGEICNLKAGDIDTSGDVWIAVLVEHKTAYADCRREILLGEKAQRILGHYLPRTSDAAVFSPREAENMRQRSRRSARKTKLYPSHLKNMKRKRKASPRRSAGEFYKEDSYRRAIHRACELAGIAKWNPNQIRHTAGTDIKRQYGWETARVVLGQASVNTTAVYAERDRERAIRAMREIG
jgi:integrase